MMHTAVHSNISIHWGVTTCIALISRFSLCSDKRVIVASPFHYSINAPVAWHCKQCCASDRACNRLYSCHAAPQCRDACTFCTGCDAIDADIELLFICCDLVPALHDGP